MQRGLAKDSKQHVPEQIRGRRNAADNDLGRQRPEHGVRQGAVVQPTADQAREQIVRRLRISACLDQAVQIGRELREGARQPLASLGAIGLGPFAVQELASPVDDPLGILGRKAQQVKAHQIGGRIRELGDELGRVVRGPVVDQALLSLETCRQLKKSAYSTPFTSMGKFISFLRRFPSVMQVPQTLPLDNRTLNQHLGVLSTMVRVEATGEYKGTKRKITTIFDLATGEPVYHNVN